MELGDPVPEEPTYFLKPPSTIFHSEKARLEIPKHGEVHHELELVFKIGPNNTLPQFTLGLDLTLRDLQSKLKKAGQPWEKAKVFRNSAVLGPWRSVVNLDSVLDMPFELRVNSQTRQKGLGSDMRWKPLEILNDVQKWFPVIEGDLIFTGTPEGVGPLHPGDRVYVSGAGIEYTLEVL